MNNPFLKNKNSFIFWLCVHCGIILALLISFFSGTRFGINTNLFDILPESNASRSVSAADKALGAKTGRSFTVLVSSSDFNKAKDAAARVYENLKDDESFEYVSLWTDSSVVTQLSSFFYDWRYNFLSSENIELLESNGGALSFAEESLVSAFSGFSFLPIDNLESDPFLLGNKGMETLLEKLLHSGTSMQLKDGVLATEMDGNWYVLLRGALTLDGASIGSKKSGVKKIYFETEKILSSVNNASNTTSNSEKDIAFYFSGVPFHSYESSSSAQTEISIISTVSLLIIILLFIIIFKNPLPVIASVLAIMLSVAFAFSANILVFHEIHILTFVFGTTLIGTCFDYSVHYFIRWKTDLAVNSGGEISSKLFRGLTMSLLSTEVCYLILCFAPFPILKQVGVFSFTGILSSYLTVMCIFPKFKIPEKNREIPFIKYFSMPEFLSAKKTKHILLCVIIFVFGILIFAFHKNIRIENNLSSFYSMKGNLLEGEKTSAKVLNHGSSGWYFIVSGKSKDELLENEKDFCLMLDKEIQNKKLSSYTAITQYISSPELQKKSYGASKALLPFLHNQLESLGFENEKDISEKIDFIKSDYESKSGKIIYPDSDLPPYLAQAFSNLWIGEIDGTWFSAVLPLHATDSDEFRLLASKTENVFFINKMQDIGNELNHLTRIMLVFLLLAICLLFPILKIFYSWKNVARIVFIPFIITAVTVAVLGVCNIPIGFFPITGLILVFGLGMDYVIYTVESSEKINSFAVFLSFITTELSFGALALSSFAPVHMFGLTVFVGITTAFLCAPLVDF